MICAEGRAVQDNLIFVENAGDCAVAPHVRAGDGLANSHVACDGCDKGEDLRFDATAAEGASEVALGCGGDTAELEGAAIHGGAAGVGVAAGEHECAIAGLDQTAGGGAAAAVGNDGVDEHLGRARGEGEGIGNIKGAVGGGGVGSGVQVNGEGGGRG